MENILVIGGGGKNGRRVVQKLQERKFNAISTSRNTNIGVHAERYFDWDDTRTYDAALKDVERVYIVHPDTSMPPALDQMAALISRLEQLPVSKAVLLSGRGQESVRGCEEVLTNSSLDWTIVRSAWFNQNFSEGHFLRGIRQGEICFMANEVREPFVDLDDVADVVVEALLDGAHNGEIHEVTGSDLLSFKETVEMISRHLGRDIVYKHLDADEYFRVLIAAGLSDSLAKHMVSAFAEILDGRNANLGNGIQQVLGRKPKRFVDFVSANQFK